MSVQPLATRASGPQPIEALANAEARITIIHGLLSRHMKKDTHYGVIPGTPKPSLWQPGADMITATFGIATHFDVSDLSTADEVRYRVRCEGSSPNGTILGEGLGECSSSEEKYRWRGAVCSQEFDETPEDRRREKWHKGKEPYKTQQVRTAPADVANTILKMAAKRAKIAMVLTVTACSDIFTQDVEEPGANGGGKAPMQRPQARQQQPAATSNGGDSQAISDAQRKRFYAIYKQAGKSDDEVKAYLASKSITSSRDIPKFLYEELCAWAEGKVQPAPGAPASPPTGEQGALLDTEPGWQG